MRMTPLLVVVALLAALVAGCSAADEAGPGHGPHVEGPVVVVVSVDGLNPTALRELGPQRVPSFTRLRGEGASTLNARTLVEQTNTLPNHTTMLTGVRLEGPHGHGVRFNEDNGSTLERTAGEYLPGIFDVAHDAGFATAMLVAKTKFRVLDRSWDAVHGAPDRHGDDDGRDKVDTFLLEDDPDDLVSALERSLPRDHTGLTFLHLTAPDAAGHEHGFMSPAYLDAVVRTDGFLGRVLSTIDGDGYLRAHATVILTADHGGAGENHRDRRAPSSYTIPFYVWGAAVHDAGVAPGADLYALNPDRRDPGTGQPGYAGPQPVRNMDVAALALTTLGLPPIGELRDDPLTVSPPP